MTLFSSAPISMAHKASFHASLPADIEPTFSPMSATHRQCRRYIQPMLPTWGRYRPDIGCCLGVDPVIFAVCVLPKRLESSLKKKKVICGSLCRIISLRARHFWFRNRSGARNVLRRSSVGRQDIWSTYWYR